MRERFVLNAGLLSLTQHNDPSRARSMITHSALAWNQQAGAFLAASRIASALRGGSNRGASLDWQRSREALNEFDRYTIMLVREVLHGIPAADRHPSANRVSYASHRRHRQSIFLAIHFF